MLNLTPEEAQAILTGPKNLSTAYRIAVYAAERKDGVTADDCASALGLPHQTASSRFHELVKSGCLTRTLSKRVTRIGGSAVIHKIAKNADFKAYIKYVHSSQYRKKKRAGLSNHERDVLAHGLAFIASWRRLKTPKGREDAAVKLVQELVALAKLQSKVR